MNRGLSNHDIIKMLEGKCEIILYPDIHKYNNIDELLGPYGCAVILFQSRPNYGHWVVLIRRGNELEFFNSYGGLPDGTFDYISKDFRKKSNQDYPYLSDLLLKSNYELHYNEFKFQKDDPKIKTCGRHAVIRALFADLDIYNYKQLLDMLCDKLNIGGDYDKLVTILTE